ITHLFQMGSDHAADGATIGGAIAMTADVLIDGTRIETGATTNTVKAFPRLLVGKDVGPAIVQQNNDHFFRPIRLAGLSWARNDGIVYRNALARAISSQKRPK